MALAHIKLCMLIGAILFTFLLLLTHRMLYSTLPNENLIDCQQTSSIRRHLTQKTKLVCPCKFQADKKDNLKSCFKINTRKSGFKKKNKNYFPVEVCHKIKNFSNHYKPTINHLSCWKS